jgi:hypothetical protein
VRELVEHPDFGEGERAPEVPVAQDADPARVKPVEPADRIDVLGRVGHADIVK